MICRLARFVRTGLLPLLLAAGLLGGLATEAVACAGEPVIEHVTSADQDASDSDDGENLTSQDACQHGHSHHGYALPAHHRGLAVARRVADASPRPVTNLSSDPPGGLERPPRI